MQKVQLMTEIDLKTLLTQLKTDELEVFLREITATLTRRRTTDAKARETALLLQLNEECALPETHWAKFHSLTEKRLTSEWTPAEADELSDLIQEEEQLRLKRIRILGELSQIKGISLTQITEQLGIKAPENGK